MVRAMNRRSVALAALFVLSGCAHRSYRFLDGPEVLAKAGQHPTQVAVREDGRRSRPGTDEFEWWYLDGVASDGTVVVIVFSDNWLPGSKRRAVTIEVTPPGKPTRTSVFYSDAPGTFATERADVHIGSNRFEGNLERYTITVSPDELQGVGCTLTLERRVPSYRPGSGMMGGGDDVFGWVVGVPEGRLSGTLTIDGAVTAFDGSGYHDHNWGNAAPWDLMRNWWWGRGEVDGNTVVMSEMRPLHGERTLPLLYVAGPGGVVVEAHGDAVRFTESPPEANDDPTHPELRARSVELVTAEPALTARFTRSGAPITTVDLLQHQSAFTRFLGRLAGKTPWYSRWRAQLEVQRSTGAAAGHGTIEFMDFE